MEAHTGLPSRVLEQPRPAQQKWLLQSVPAVRQGLRWVAG